MKEVRVFKTIQYWVDVELGDDQENDEAIDIAMDIDQSDWEYEVTDSGILEEYWKN
jgi:uncharacterized membrane protein YukC